jgi:hypothetical protein
MSIGRLFSVLTKVGAEHRHNYRPRLSALRYYLFNGLISSMEAALKLRVGIFGLTHRPVARNIIRTQFIHRGQAALILQKSRV